MSRGKTLSPISLDTAHDRDTLARLRETLPPGATVYTKLTSVARSGMSRKMQVIVLDVVQRCRHCATLVRRDEGSEYHASTCPYAEPRVADDGSLLGGPRRAGVVPETVGVAAPRYWTRFVARLCRLPYDDDESAIVMRGCGMDMGFALVYDLSHTLYPDGADVPQVGYQQGGYVLRHAWL